MVDPIGETADRWLELFDAVEGTDGEADVSRLTFERELGQVDDTAMFLAHDPELGANVVVQTVNSGDGADHSRFLEEARLLQEVNNHHVRQVISVGIGSDNRPYAVMEHVDRGSLRGRLDSGIEPERVDVDRLVDFLAAAMQTLRESPLADHHVGVEDVVLQSVLPGSYRPGRLFADDERLLLGERIANLESDANRFSTDLDLRVDRPPFRQVELPFDLRGASAIVGELVCGAAPPPEMSWLEHLRKHSRFPELNSAILNGLSDLGEQPESIEAWRQELLSDNRLADDDRDAAGLGAWFVDLRAHTKPSHYAVAGIMCAIMTGVLIAGTGVVDDNRTEAGLDEEVAAPETSESADTSETTASTAATSSAESTTTTESTSTNTESSTTSSTASLTARATLPTTRRTTTTKSTSTTATTADSSSTSESSTTDSGSSSTGSSDTSSSSTASSTTASTTTTTEATTTTTTTEPPAATGQALEMSGVGVESVGTNSAVLTWDSVSGADKYEVRLNGGATSVASQSDTSWRFPALPVGRNALLEVRAVAADQEKGPWAGQLAELLGTDGDGSNTAFNPSPSASSTSSSITVTWPSVSDGQGYDVYLNTTWKSAPQAGDTSFTFTDLEPNTNYLVEVQTKVGDGGDRSERVPVLIKTQS